MSKKVPLNGEDSVINSLSNFIEVSRNQGVSDEIIYKLLKNQGWSTPEIESAFTLVIEKLVGFSLPRPSQPRSESSREAFLYLLSFATLGIWSQALGSIGFMAVNRLVEDSLTESDGSFRLAASLARLIVVYPIYLLLMKLLMNNLANYPENYQSGVRKWLTYLALFITALIVIADLVWFLTSFLTGSLTLRFVGKSLIILIIAGGIFAYYLTWLLRPPVSS
jgi:hypothetical protein